MKSPQLHILNFDFGRVEIYNHYLIATIKEGIVFDNFHLDTFCQIFDQYFPNRPFGYISNRVNDYTVNPTCYSESHKYPMMTAIAVCCYSEKSRLTAQFEKSFYDKPFHVFNSLKDCENWIEDLVYSEIEIRKSQQ